MALTNKRKIGDTGENVCCSFLESKGFRIIDRNYLKKWGEIDVIAEKDNVLRFIEVKTVSRENVRDISRETLDSYRPEENVHPWKLKRLSRTIQGYLLGNKVKSEKLWQLDVMAVFLDLKNREAKVRFTENIVIEN